MSFEPQVLHETSRRLRIALPGDVLADAVEGELLRIEGVGSVRINLRVRCVIVEYDGSKTVRAAVMRRLGRGHFKAGGQTAGRRAVKSRPPADRPDPRVRTVGALNQAAGWAPALLALGAVFASGPWRSGLALSGVALRALSRRDTLIRDPAAVFLDSASLATLSLGGQVPVVAASMLLRQLEDALSKRLVGQADRLLEHLLPAEAARYWALRAPGDKENWWPLRELRVGDRIRLEGSDVVPLDGCVITGQASLEPVLPGAEPRHVVAGDAVAAGERVARGSLVVRADTDCAHSRLTRLRAHLRHVIAARDPAGRLSQEGSRLVSLPLTAAGLVYGFTRDAARAAAMLQADPQQGLDLAQPLAREASLYALARIGLIASGLETVSRLATARTLVLQDSGVLACGRWTVQEVRVGSGTSRGQVLQWIGRLVGVAPGEALSVPDAVVREWYRHGALLRTGSREVHLASIRRLRSQWGLALPDGLVAPSGEEATALRRQFAVLAGGRVIAGVLLASEWREGVAGRLNELRQTGFERIAVVAEDGGDPSDERDPPAEFPRDAWITEGAAAVSDWLAAATHDGLPAVVVHTVFREVVPPGSLGLAPSQAEAGPHGVLVSDPVATLLTARRLAQTIDARIRWRQGFAVAANAILMTAGAVRWVPPMAVTLTHHGASLLLLLDSLRLEGLNAKQPVREEGPSTQYAEAPVHSKQAGLATALSISDHDPMNERRKNS